MSTPLGVAAKTILPRLQALGEATQTELPSVLRGRAGLSDVRAARERARATVSRMLDTAPEQTVLMAGPKLRHDAERLRAQALATQAQRTPDLTPEADRALREQISRQQGQAHALDWVAAELPKPPEELTPADRALVELQVRRLVVGDPQTTAAHRKIEGSLRGAHQMEDPTAVITTVEREALERLKQRRARPARTAQAERDLNRFSRAVNDGLDAFRNAYLQDGP